MSTIVSSPSRHRAYAVTGPIATISAAVAPDSIVERIAGAAVRESPATLRIGHPTGVIEPRLDWRCNDGGISIDRAYIVRTARRLMSGITYLL